MHLMYLTEENVKLNYINNQHPHWAPTRIPLLVPKIGARLRKRGDMCWDELTLSAYLKLGKYYYRAVKQ